MSAPQLKRVRKYRPLPEGLTQERIDRYAHWYSGRALSGLDPSIVASLPKQARSRVLQHFVDRHGLAFSSPVLAALRKLWVDVRKELGDFYVTPRNPRRRPRKMLPGASNVDRTGAYTALLLLDPSVHAAAFSEIPGARSNAPLAGHAGQEVREIH